MPWRRPIRRLKSSACLPPPALPAPPTRVWRGHTATSSSCSTVTPRWSPALSRPCSRPSTATHGWARPAPSSTIRTVARSGAAGAPRACSGCSPWRAACRSAWEAAGPMDEGFRFYAQDLDLCLRLRQAGWSVELVPEFRVLHHHGATIGQASGGGGRQHPELLWTDLLRWAVKHRGAAWARQAARVLRAGAALRLLGRSLATPFVAAERRAGWREESGAFRRAAAAVKLANPGQAL